MEYDKNIIYGDGYGQYIEILLLLEGDGVINKLNKKMYFSWQKRKKEEAKQNKIKKNECLKYFRQIDREMNREIQKLMNSLKIKI